MAITSPAYTTKNGSPTSWSGAVDNIAYGDNEKKRLFFISAGNMSWIGHSPDDYPEANQVESVQSPGQAWNAITVGAYSNDIQINDKLLANYSALADVGALSPISVTSMMWDRGWPIKPEILCDGGNIATDGQKFTNCPDLSLLTTHHLVLARMFSSINGTSSATAQAAWLAAQIMAQYPGIWPETVRALLVHSAQWTGKMKKQLCKDDQKATGRRALLRTCGYGIPDLGRAIQCKNNRVNMIVQGIIQPFSKNGMNEMHLLDMPWPKEVLRELGTIPAEMKVTLSYFIEPAPGEIGWKDKYRYSSCGLRFEVIDANETKEEFIQRVNLQMREDGYDKNANNSSARWYLGTKLRDVGSIHSDYMTQNAVDLCDARYIAIFPVVGWWRERKNLKCFNKEIRYSLIVSVSTQETKIDLYTPIITQIETATKVPTEIEVAIRPKKTRNSKNASA
jgi:hypothetical protein